jgi:hypothetical protein
MTDNTVSTEKHLQDAKRGVAILVTCLAQEINEIHPGFLDRFMVRLARAYREVREEDNNHALDRLELLNWTRELLSGWNMTSGQGEPFLKD